MSEVIVLFEVTLQPGRSEDYLSQAASLKAVLSEATGLIRAERFFLSGGRKQIVEHVGVGL